jgi:hypothetical protein
MTTPAKVFAPRPIRASHNLRGVKISIKSFERVEAPICCQTPEPRNKISFEKNQNFSLFKEHKLKLKKMKTYESNLYLQDDTNFSRMVENDFRSLKIDDDSISKSEILSILRSDSNNFDSMYPSTNDEEELFTWEEVRKSPPVRSQNPIYKNFENNQCSELNFCKEIKESTLVEISGSVFCFDANETEQK